MRKLTERLIVQGDLIARTPLHVGGMSEDVRTDLPLARDGEGRFYIPGTSLAGALRHWCERTFGETRVKPIWGWQAKKGARDDANHGHASFVVVDDCRLPAEADSEIRDGVGIDRVTGTAARRIKFDRAILPRGTRLPLRLVWEVESGQEEAIRVMLSALVTALIDGEIRFGAAKSRGLGRVRMMQAPTILCQRLDQREAMLALLADREAGTPLSLAQPGEERNWSPPPRLEIRIAWRPTLPVMVKAGYDGIAVDMLPLVSADGERIAPVLPGSALKGALRAQAERIVRTIRNHDASGSRFADQIACDPLIERLFGAPGRRADAASEREKPENQSPREGLGALHVDDCYAVPRLDPATWQAIANDEAALRRAVDSAAGSIRFEPAHHVAIDRWTGGAAEHLLFSVLEPHAAEGAWEPFLLTFDPSRLKPEHRQPAFALLLLVLRDLGAGRIPIGFGGNRGLGGIAVTGITLTARHWRGSDAEFAALPGEILLAPDLKNLPQALADTLWQAWEKYCGGASA